ncbi:MAG TPA: AMP-binding protein [Solimonas sp.]
MSRVLEAVTAHAMHRPDAVALDAPGRSLTYAALTAAIARQAALLHALGIETLGLYADNGVDWVVTDLAARRSACRLVPLPLFFSPTQIEHAIRDAGVEWVLAPANAAARLPFDFVESQPLDDVMSLYRPRAFAGPVRLPAGTQKITYTSGTTGDPKGVCLSLATMERVAQSLGDATGADAQDRHLCALPLSTLLENIGGVDAPLLAGATVCLRPLAAIGLDGASGIDPLRLLDALRSTQATSAILVPQMLHALCVAIERGAAAPTALRFVAVGGAPVSPTLLHRAAALGLPVYEGYGLSECASVVALNRIGDSLAGSVGRPLPHITLQVSADGEVRVAGNGFLGYVGQAPRAADAPVSTGDLGRLDADGRLVLTGRRKNLFVTAFGRNVSPEWVERELDLQPAIARAAVFGEARPWNAAVIVVRAPAAAADVAAAIAAVNAGLPDYARVRRWIAADAPFTPDNQLATTNGRLCRERIWTQYQTRIDSLYEEPVDELS